MTEPMLNSAMRSNPTGQVRVYREDGKLTMGTPCRGYLAEQDEMIRSAKSEALREAAKEARERGDIGKEDDGGIKSWIWLEYMARKAEGSLYNADGTTNMVEDN